MTRQTRQRLWVVVLIIAGLAVVGRGGWAVLANLADDRRPAREHPLATFLKDRLLTAQVQYQAGAYRDPDGDGRGAYGSIAALRARHLLDEPVGPDQTWHGYRCQVWLLDGAGGAYPASAAGPGTEVAQDLAERAFLTYAWPADGQAGAVLCITNQGELLVAASGSVALPPAPAAAFPELTLPGTRQPSWPRLRDEPGSLWP